MGYYSSVSLSMQKNDYINMLSLAAKENNKNIWLLITKDADIFKNNEVITLYWSSIKWYSNYQDISFVLNYLKTGIKYSLKRIGEEYDDIESKENLYNDDKDMDIDDEIYLAADIVSEIVVNDMSQEIDIDSFIKENHLA